MKRIFSRTLAVLLSLVLLLLPLTAASAQTTDIKTPVDAEKTHLLWALGVGTGYKNAPSTPVIYGDMLYTMSGYSLFKIDTQTGKIVAEAEMTKRPSLSGTPVLCDGGRVYCPLEDGTLEAYDAETLQRFWSFSDTLGGQPLSSLLLANGKLYTGFWNDEELDANFVCVDALSGELVWSFTHKGGFYGTRAAEIDSKIITGSDNGSGEIRSECTVYCFDGESGRVLDSFGVSGDCRSGICAVTGTNDFVFTTKAGYFCKASVSDDGFGDVETLELTGASTSTPTVYNGRAYIGVQSSGFSGEVQIIDINEMQVLYSLTAKGYPQSEMLLTTAYEAENGGVYVYATYNSPPGGIMVIRDNPSESPSISELFAPAGAQAQYCLSGIAVDEDGKMYYKNDSGVIFALEYKEPEPEKEPTFFEKIGGIFESFFRAIRLFFEGVFGLR